MDVYIFVMFLCLSGVVLFLFVRKRNTDSVYVRCTYYSMSVDCIYFSIHVCCAYVSVSCVEFCVSIPKSYNSDRPLDCEYGYGNVIGEGKRFGLSLDYVPYLVWYGSLPVIFIWVCCIYAFMRFVYVISYIYSCSSSIVITLFLEHLRYDVLISITYLLEFLLFPILIIVMYLCRTPIIMNITIHNLFTCVLWGIWYILLVIFYMCPIHNYLHFLDYPECILQLYSWCSTYFLFVSLYMCHVHHDLQFLVYPVCSFHLYSWCLTYILFGSLYMCYVHNNLHSLDYQECSFRFCYWCLTCSLFMFYILYFLTINF